MCHGVRPRVRPSVSECGGLRGPQQAIRKRLDSAATPARAQPPREQTRPSRLPLTGPDSELLGASPEAGLEAAAVSPPPRFSCVFSLRRGPVGRRSLGGCWPAMIERAPGRRPACQFKDDWIKSLAPGRPGRCRLGRSAGESESPAHTSRMSPSHESLRAARQVAPAVMMGDSAAAAIRERERFVRLNLQSSLRNLRCRA